MKYAADFRTIARGSLRGKWHVSALTAFMASLIGAIGGSSSLNTESSSLNSDSIASDWNLNEYFSPDVLNFFRIVLAVLLAYAGIHIIVSLIIGGAGKLGYAGYNLNLTDGREARFTNLFSQFHRLGEGFVMNLLLNVYIFLWAFLFVIPGIVKTFSYAMTPYILYEHPEYSPNYAITLSRKMMDGNKFRLFCLKFSFIGWSILSSVPSLIASAAALTGSFVYLPLILVTIVAEQFVVAYIHAAEAAFYREVSGTEPQAEIFYAEIEP